MKIVQINSVCGSGSTGKICVAISELLSEKGVENYILYALGNTSYPLGRKYMSSFEVKLQALKSRIFGNYGFQSKSATKRLIKELDRISPDIVHLHNLHSHNVHLRMLFSCLKERNVKVFWTFHDCWAFTGYCCHYDMIGCKQWKNACVECPKRRHYSWFFDRSGHVFEKKKKLLEGIDITVITPSRWLAEQVKQSFLEALNVRVIYNGIDLSVFYPQTSDFRQRYHLENKYIILGVAFDWGQRKGLDVFIEFAMRLDDRFRIVMVGTNEDIDRQLPDNIISIHRTQDQKELAEIYTAADLFINPTREEVLGLVNIEALACGTPVVTFETGGSPECIDETCGVVVEKDDIDKMLNTVIEICETKPFYEKDCIKHACLFDADQKFTEYVNLYSCSNE